MNTQQLECPPPPIYIPRKHLVVHPHLQRAVDWRHVERIASKYDPAAVGCLDVVPSDKPPIYWIFDGQHRVLAGTKYYNGDVERSYRCQVHDGLSQKEVARLCLLRNASRAWHALDRWSARLVAEDPVATEIEAMLRRFRLHTGPAKGQVRAVIALEHAWSMEQGPKITTRALHILWAAWGQRRAELGDAAVKLKRADRLVECYDAIFISGVVLLLRLYGRLIDDDDLAHRASKAGTPAVLIGKAREGASFHSVTSTRAMAMVFIGIYNKGRRSHGLPRMVK